MHLGKCPRVKGVPLSCICAIIKVWRKGVQPQIAQIEREKGKLSLKGFEQEGPWVSGSGWNQRSSDARWLRCCCARPRQGAQESERRCLVSWMSHNFDLIQRINTARLVMVNHSVSLVNSSCHVVCNNQMYYFMKCESHMQTLVKLHSLGLSWNQIFYDLAH